MDTFKRVKANGFTVVMYEYCMGFALVRYCGMDGKQINRDKFWIAESELQEF